MLAVENLAKRFGDRWAVNDISFLVAPGEVFFLLGANGAGKTTTLNMLLGFVPPSAGRALLDGRDLWRDRDICRRQIMYVPENVNLYPNFNAIENIGYLTSLADIKINRETIVTSLLTCGITETELEKPLAEFSKGMRQKVAIAFALLKEAKLLLMDEPTSGLDPTASRDFVGVIETIRKRDTAVLIVAHDLQCAHVLADRIGIMKRGKLVDVIESRNMELDNIESVYFKQYLPG